MTMRRFPRSAWFWIPIGAALPIALWLAAPSLAYDSYSDGTSLGRCAYCHETAAGGFQSRGALHDAHTAHATGTCQACHMKQGDIPFLDLSGDAVLNKSCTGCHGGYPGGRGSGDGLRRHHYYAGAPPDIDGLYCIDCHHDTAPPAESVNPLYYGLSGVVQTSACNVDGKEDFWSHATGLPDGKGLDNDGDLLVDAADGDCAVVACIDRDQDGYGDPGDPSCANGSATDCDDTHADAYPGAPERYDQRDNNCNTEVDEIEQDGFFDAARPDRYSWQAQAPAPQLYDVIRSDAAGFPAGSPNSACLVVGTALAYQDDPVSPASGGAFYYLVRNTLVSDYGKRSDGTLRLDALCP
jgi:Putative metal-binding motif